MSGSRKLQRRDVVIGVGVGAGALIVGVSARVDAALPAAGRDAPGMARPGQPTRELKDTARGQQPEVTPEIAALVAALPAGSRLGDFTVAAIHPVQQGGLPVILEGEGERFQVDVLRRSADSAEGVAWTGTCSLYVANQGNGQRATGVRQGLGARALAQALTSVEDRGVKLPPLMSLQERAHRFPAGIYSVL